MKNKKSFLKGALCGALLMLVILVGGFIAIFFLFVKLGLGSGDLITGMTEQKIGAIRSMINQEYLYEKEIDEDALQQSLIKGYVAGLGDPYSVYYDAEETRSLLEATSGEFGGIGVGLTQDAETKVIEMTTVYENSPGEKAGLKSGDILYKVNGEDITGQDLDSVVAKIRGEKGTDVELTILRGSRLEEKTFQITRDIIEVNTVSYEMKEGNVGYIRVSGFEKVTYQQFETALSELKAKGMKGLIVDLRNNPGGNLDTVCDMLDLILPEGTIVSIKDRDGKGETFTSDEEHKLELPMAVLINGNSASASEIFAGAIQDYGIGTLVGTTTFGKGIVQNIYQLPDGTALKITTSEYFTPNGRNIHGIGIEPDMEVKYEYDEENPDVDNQLEAAMECLN